MSSRTDLPAIVRTGGEIRELVIAAQARGERVGVVPTMGALHEGHLSLVDAARGDCDVVVATVFVNPTQFGPGEDFQQYPRDLASDVELLAARGCDVVFAPATEEMYPDGYETSVDVGGVAKPLEGMQRPTHFAGVATVVLKLLNLVPANAAYFGQKDYQQTIVVQRMMADLNVPTAMVVCPTVREADGLAMSSRNRYLDDDERRRAPALYASLQLASQMVRDGERSTVRLRQAVEQYLGKVGGIQLDYVAFVAAGTIAEVESIDGPTVALIAGRIGRSRLIDNLEIG